MEKAILMAAGLGSRMRPLTEKVPKPLIPVHGKPMIETLIEGLLARGVEEIAVVTGYLCEQFSYLCDRYPNVKLLYNPHYLTRNNISSLYAALDYLQEGDCFICESDLYISDPAIFKKELTKSCYYARMQEGHSDDWVFDVQDGIITRIGKGGDDTYNMVGIAYFKEKDGKVLSALLEDAFAKEENADRFWDEIVNDNLDRLTLTVEPVPAGALVEIDTVEELRKIHEGG